MISESLEGMMDVHFKAYHYIWRAISKIVTPEQGWYIFMNCLDIAEGCEDPEPIVDPVVESLVRMVMYSEKCRNQPSAYRIKEVYPNGK